MTTPEPISTEPPAAGAATSFQKGRAAFRAWRGARPFWAGLFVLLAGGEILFLALAPPALLPAMGIGGIGTWLMGALLLTAGALLWFQPALRVLLGVATILFTLVSLVTSNLGGFLFGALLGLVGGALACAWTPQPTPRRSSADPAHTSSAAENRDTETPQRAQPEPSGEPRDAPRGPGAGPGRPGAPSGSEHEAPQPVGSGGRDGSEEAAERVGPAGRGRVHAGRHRAGGFGAFVIVLGLAIVAGAVAAGRAEADILPLPLPGTSPSPTATSTPDPAPSTSPDPGAAEPGDGLIPDPGSTPTPGPDEKKADKKDKPPPKADADAVPLVHDPVVRSTAARMVTEGIDFKGIAKLRTDDGRREVLAFAMDRVTLNDYLMSAPDGAKMLHCGVLTLNGEVRLYTSELRVKVLGLPLTLTPDTPKLLLKAVKLTDGQPTTDVRQLQDFVRADDLNCSPATNWAG